VPRPRLTIASRRAPARPTSAPDMTRQVDRLRFRRRHRSTCGSTIRIRARDPTHEVPRLGERSSVRVDRAVLSQMVRRAPTLATTAISRNNPSRNLRARETGCVRTRRSEERRCDFRRRTRPNLRRRGRARVRNHLTREAFARCVDRARVWRCVSSIPAAARATSAVSRTRAHQCVKRLTSQ
jgi:hypothetical protein